MHVRVWSLTVLIASREQVHQSQLTETLNGFNPNYVNGLANITHTLQAQGLAPGAASQAATAELYRSLGTQAQMLSFVDAFHALMVVIMLLTPLIFLMKGRPAGAAGGGGH